jgi:thiol-disulfide isomerase/thioredoxin
MRLSILNCLPLVEVSMIRRLACFALLLSLLFPVAARADVTTGNASPGMKGFAERHGSELSGVGPLAQSLQGKPVVARIHADWCPACKATQGTIDQLKTAYAGKINFVQFNMTNAKTAAASDQEAQKLGLEQFFSASESATSTVAVIDPKTGKVYATFYNDGQLGDYSKAIDEAIADEHR